MINKYVLLKTCENNSFSKIPKRYKRNTILRYLCRSNRISSNFNVEIKFVSHRKLIILNVLLSV